jgi:hypothetical protein
MKAWDSKYRLLYSSLVLGVWHFLARSFMLPINPVVSESNILIKRCGLRIQYRIIYPLLPNVGSNEFAFTTETIRNRFAYMRVCVCVCVCVCAYKFLQAPYICTAFAMCTYRTVAKSVKLANWNWCLHSATARMKFSKKNANRNKDMCFHLYANSEM